MKTNISTTWIIDGNKTISARDRLVYDVYRSKKTGYYKLLPVKFGEFDQYWERVNNSSYSQPKLI